MTELSNRIRCHEFLFEVITFLNGMYSTWETVVVTKLPWWIGTLLCNTPRWMAFMVYAIAIYPCLVVFHWKLTYSCQIYNTCDIYFTDKSNLSLIRQWDLLVGINWSVCYRIIQFGVELTYNGCWAAGLTPSSAILDASTGRYKVCNPRWKRKTRTKKDYQLTKTWRCLDFIIKPSF